MTSRNQHAVDDPPKVEPQRLGGMPRWAVYGGRVLLWGLLAALVGLGIAGIVTSGASDQPAVNPSAGWPTGDAESLALREADRWLTDSSTAGGSEVSGLTVVDVAVDGDRATVTVAARLPAPGDDPVGGRSAERWTHVAVPVHNSGGQVGLAGTPALVAAPPPAAALDAPSGQGTAPQPVIETVEGWAEAFAEGGPGLSRWTTTDTTDPAGLAGRVALDDVLDVRTVDKPDDGRATVLAEVRWRLDPSGEEADGPSVTQTYRLELTRDGGRWYVRQVAVGYPTSNNEE